MHLVSIAAKSSLKVVRTEYILLVWTGDPLLDLNSEPIGERDRKTRAKLSRGCEQSLSPRDHEVWKQ